MGGARRAPFNARSTRGGIGGLVSLLFVALALAPGAGAVTGGTQVPITDAPWQVEIVSIGESGFRYCGGAIISDRLVLTAAHCVAGAFNTALVAGDSKYNGEEPTQQSGPVKSKRIDPGFSASGSQPSADDVAVLELETPLRFGAGAVEPIAIAPSGSHWSAGTEVQVTGFGQHDGKPNESLYSLNTKLLPGADCGEAGGFQCTSTSGGTTCFGDSGSGLTLPGTSPTLIGLVDRAESSSSETCTAGAKDAYINLAAPAIQQFIGNIPASEGAPKPPSTPQQETRRSSVRLGARKLSVSRGSAIVKLDCSGSARCRGKLTLTAVQTVETNGKKRRKTVTIGAASFSVAGGATAKVKIRLSVHGRAQAQAAHGHLKAVIGILGFDTEPTHRRNQDVTLL